MNRKPVPSPDAVSRAYWERLKQGRLAYQHCRKCSACWLPASPACPACWCSEIEWRDSSGSARLLTWATYHRAYHPAFANSTPYVVGFVELGEGPRLMAGICCDDREILRAGLRLHLELEEREEGVRVPVFVARATAGGNDGAD